MKVLGAGWRPALRMAWRDARRSRGRSALVLVMIALPVLGVTAVDVVFQTQTVAGAEALERRLGAADARVTIEEGITEVVQGFDPDQQLASTGSSGTAEAAGRQAGIEDVTRLLGGGGDGDGVRALQWWAYGTAEVTTDAGLADVEVSAVDLADPLAAGLFDLREGRLPEAADEVVVNSALAERGVGLGDELEAAGRGTYEVVGVGESTTVRDRPVAVALDPAIVGTTGPRADTWLLEAGDVSWAEVRQLNDLGVLVLSRAVLEDPPPADQLPAEIQEWGSGGTDDAAVAVAVLIVVMALLEVVLLAGPAFAVGARRQARSLALLAACGGTPVQARRVVLAAAVVLGSLGAFLGAVLGIVVAWAVLPLLQRFSSSWFGPFDVPWSHLVLIAGFGLLSAFLAALVPASIASRQDVVAVLAGRRGDRAPSLRSPLAGLALLAAGIGGSAYGATARQNGEFMIAVAAVLAVLGMILLVPVVVTGLARVSSGLPLPLRYAVRDAARHRTRTVPAVAAVAATVTGVVALGVANSSDSAQNRAEYQPALPLGMASLVLTTDDEPTWQRLTAALARELPGHEGRPVDGVPTVLGADGYREIVVRLPGADYLVDSSLTTLGSPLLVGEEALEAVGPAMSQADRKRAAEGFTEGRAVVFASRDVSAEVVRVGARTYVPDGDRAAWELRPVEVPAVFVRPRGPSAPAQAVLPQALADQVGLQHRPVSLLVDGGVSAEQEEDVSEAMAVISRDASFYVERGFQRGGETTILLLVLGGLGGLLMLGGTLTATSLSLSDARPDLATLAAVGAAPRTRRAVAAAYALVIGLVGAVLGALVGFVPGIAVTYPLTSQSWASVDATGRPMPDHFLDVPWTLVGVIVVGLPLLTAAVVALTARSRLPMTGRAAA